MQVVCSNGVLVNPERVTPPVAAEGTVTALSSNSISVHGEHDLTCTLGASSPRLGDYHVGDRVRIACSAGVLVGIARQ